MKIMDWVKNMLQAEEQYVLNEEEIKKLKEEVKSGK